MFYSRILQIYGLSVLTKYILQKWEIKELNFQLNTFSD